MENTNTSYSNECTGKHTCGRWRVCDRCARLRAARLADRAEYLEQRHGRLALAVAKPRDNTESALRALRDSLVRSKLAPAGIWTVETGELFMGLHLNLIIPEHNAHAFAHRAEYVETIRTSTRATAAYIAKRSGMPAQQQYSGRLLGEWGSVVQHIMASREMQAAPCQAAVAQLAISGKRSIADYYKTDAEMLEKYGPKPQPQREKTRAEYAEIARRNLAAVYMACAGHTIAGH